MKRIREIKHFSSSDEEDQIIKRNLFNVVAKRPISSPYFEMILKNENWR